MERFMGPRPKNTLALTVGGSWLQAVERQGDHVSWWGLTPLPDGVLGATGHVVVDTEKLTNCIRELVQDLVSRNSRVVLAIPDFRATWVTKAFPAKIPKRDRQALAEDVHRYEKARMLLTDGQDIRWGVEEGGGGEHPWYVYWTSRPKGQIYAFAQGVTQAGLKPSLMEPRALSLLRAAGLPTCVCVNAERDSIEVAINQQGMPLVMRSSYLNDSDVRPRYYQDHLVNEVLRALQPPITDPDDNLLEGFPADAPLVFSGEMALEDSGLHLQGVLEEVTGGRPVVQPTLLGVSLPAELPVEFVAAAVGASLAPPSPSDV